MHRAARSGLLAVVMCVAGAHLATAEPILLHDGYLTMDPNYGELHLEGARGFSFHSRVNSIDGSFNPTNQCRAAACHAGEAVSLDATWGGLALFGTATLDGMTFEQVGGMESDTSVVVNFFGTATMPAFLGEPVIVTAPFTFGGGFFHPGAAERLVGLGTASLNFAVDPSDPAGWFLQSARYDFAPVPEPATLLLVSGALAGVAARRRARQRG